MPVVGRTRLRRFRKKNSNWVVIPSQARELLIVVAREQGTPEPISFFTSTKGVFQNENL
jgi:hypothetical protein